MTTGSTQSQAEFMRIGGPKESNIWNSIKVRGMKETQIYANKEVEVPDQRKRGRQNQLTKMNIARV